MASHRTSMSLWRPIKAVLRGPLKVLAGYMAGTGRTLNDTYYPGAGGGIGADSPDQLGRPARRTPRRPRFRRRNH